MGKTYEQIVFGFDDYDQDRRDEELTIISDIEWERIKHGLEGEEY